MAWRLTMATRIQCYESNFSGGGERTLGAGKDRGHFGDRSTPGMGGLNHGLYRCGEMRR
jgi:hypothetical protein